VAAALFGAFFAMFESRERLAHEIEGLLLALRNVAPASEACLFDRRGLLFDSAEGEGPGPLSEFLESRRGDIFAIPERLEGNGPEEDVFESWDGGDVLLAFINGRVAVALSCADAEAAQEEIRLPLRALADRLLRFEAGYRLDKEGRGLFFGSPRLDLVLVGHPAADES
jgi:hypothetical protein